MYLIYKKNTIQNTNPFFSLIFQHWSFGEQEKQPLHDSSLKFLQLKLVKVTRHRHLCRDLLWWTTNDSSMCHQLTSTTAQKCDKKSKIKSKHYLVHTEIYLLESIFCVLFRSAMCHCQFAKALSWSCKLAYILSSGFFSYTGNSWGLGSEGRRSEITLAIWGAQETVHYVKKDDSCNQWPVQSVMENRITCAPETVIVNQQSNIVTSGQGKVSHSAVYKDTTLSKVQCREIQNRKWPLSPPSPTINHLIYTNSTYIVFLNSPHILINSH